MASDGHEDAADESSDSALITVAECHRARARELEERKKRLTGLATEEDVKKREEKLMGAKERALERKRKREEELKKAAAGGDGQPPS